MTDWPRISIVTPSYNQGSFLEATLRSIHGQGYPNLQHVVIDGGSADSSPAILAAWSDRLAHWVSEPDAGQYAALNKGFAHTDGPIMAWLNSDDMYCHWTFKLVARILADCPEVDWLTTSMPLFYRPDDTPKHIDQYTGFTRHRFLWGWTLSDSPHHCGWIQQESTFWRRSLWERAGAALDTDYRLAGDFELWARFWEHAPLYTVAMPLGGLRMHDDRRGEQGQAHYLAEAHRVLARYTPPPLPPARLLPWLRRAPRPLRPLTRRLARRFADKRHTVYYDWQAERWRTGWSYVI